MKDKVRSDQIAGALHGFWYAVLPSNRLPTRKLTAALLLDLPLVIGRSANGSPFALRDNCPHRGMPLSFGRLEADTIECCYHGWQFDCTTGQCKSIPSLTEASKIKVDRIHVGQFHCQEKDGYIWVYLPDEYPATERAPSIPTLPVHSEKFHIVHVSVDLPCNVDDGMLGLIDPAHGAFVHQSWYWRSSRNLREKEKTYEPIPNGFRMIAHSPATNSAAYKILRLTRYPVTTSIDVVLPNMRIEEIRCGPYWLTNRTMITPIKQDLSRLDFVAAWNMFRFLPFSKTIFHAFATRFIKQDQEVMKKQVIGLSYNPKLMMINDADRLIDWYFQLKSAYLEARASGKPMIHPLTGPTTLRWRT